MKICNENRLNRREPGAKAFIRRNRSLFSVALLGLAQVLSGNVLAQSYPVKAVRLIVPFPPGIYTDTIARLVAQKASEGLSQPVIVENRAGAGGNIGAEFVSKSPPDGYTLLMGSIAQAVSMSVYDKLAYDLVRDLTAVSMVLSVPNILVANPGLPVKTTAELIALAKAHPGKLTYGSGGNGGAFHLMGEMFKVHSGTNIVHVPYKGGGPALVDVVGGQISIMFITLDSALPYMNSGKLRALGVASMKRSPLAPELPTLAESVLPGFEIVTWAGILAPSETPRNIVARLNAEIGKALQLADVQKRFQALGVEIAPSTPEEFAQFIKAEIAKWTQVVKAAGVKID